ncbi:phosphatidate cytidylyltransferase [Panacagrimonas sp.]|uniref:phosphatidate cytidylyltransferase n=1 Tax=Panacagrimonas sp. TaxID=2480088 RepID=UPI003B523BAB
MLIQRVLTALVLLPMLLAAVWFLEPPALYAVFCVAGLLAMWEWAGLMGAPASTTTGRAVVVAICAVALLVAWFFRQHAVWVLAAALLWWLYVLLALLRGYPENFQHARPQASAMLGFGLLMVVPTMLGLWVLHAMPEGALRVLFLFFLVFAADTGAYFAGRRYGRRKLAPSISPGKTVEGLCGGLGLSAVWTLLAGPFVFGLQTPLAVLPLLGLCLLVAGFSVVGDLCESLFKRAAGIKDSGRILPGHGGMLDRVDSVLAAAPTMALGLIVLKI